MTDETSTVTIDGAVYNLDQFDQPYAIEATISGESGVEIVRNPPDFEDPDPAVCPECGRPNPQVQRVAHSIDEAVSFGWLTPA